MRLLSLSGNSSPAPAETSNATFFNRASHSEINARVAKEYIFSSHKRRAKRRRLLRRRRSPTLTLNRIHPYPPIPLKPYHQHNLCAVVNKNQVCLRPHLKCLARCSPAADRAFIPAVCFLSIYPQERVELNQSCLYVRLYAMQFACSP